MNGALRIVIWAISAHLIGNARLRQAQARTGAITLIQRFGGELNLNTILGANAAAKSGR